MVGKSGVIHILEIAFTLLNKKKKLMILVPIRCAAENIKNCMMHITLSINTCRVKSLCTNISGIWTHQSLLIVNELGIIYLKFLTKIYR